MAFCPPHGPFRDGNRLARAILPSSARPTVNSPVGLPPVLEAALRPFARRSTPRRSAAGHTTG
jgi:hypothetical protein